MADEPNIIEIPVVKGKGTIGVDMNKLPDDVVQEIWFLGLKSILNRGMTEVTGDDSAEKRKEAMTIAADNVQKCYEGKIRKTSGAKSTKAGGEVMTEARRLAKAEVKAALKEQGHKVSYIPASEITRLANEWLATDDGKEIIEQAKATVAARTKKAKASKDGKAAISFEGVKIDEKLKAKDEAKKAERKTKSDAKKAAAAKAGTPAKGKGAEARA